MAALQTVGDFIEECRLLLQDRIEPYRYADAELISAFNISLLEARRLRADLFLSLSMVTPSYTTADMAVVVPMEDMYRPSFVYYVVGRAQLQDNEETTDARASSLMNKFVGQMLTAQS